MMQLGHWQQSWISKKLLPSESELVDEDRIGPMGVSHCVHVSPLLCLGMPAHLMLVVGGPASYLIRPAVPHVQQ